MKSRIISIASWIIILWIAKIFLSSLPYKFTGHPDTQHIFSTIGGWMSNTISTGLGHWFTQYGAYAVGSAELIVSIILLSPAVFFILKKLNLIGNTPDREIIHSIGGVMASSVMLGAVFFHLATPLGIVVLHNGQSDNGSLFFAAVSILILGITMALVNYTHWRSQKSAT